MKQDEFNSILAVLNNYAPKSKKYIETKNSLLNNAKNFYEKREKIIKGFKDGIFPLKSNEKTDFDELNEPIIEEETEINKELFKNYFEFQKLTEILKNLSNLNDKNKNKQLVDMIRSGLIDLKNEIKKMSEDEIKIEKP